MKTFEGIVDVNKYIINNKEEVIKNFEESASYFLLYRKGIQTNPKYPVKAKCFMKYTVEWYNFIKEVIGTYRTVPNQNYTFYSNYETMRKQLSLPLVTINNNEYLPTVWGPRTWKFLHYSSILIQDNDILISTFACLLLNFDLFILCGICKEHFKRKDPISTIVMRIKYSKDPITVLFNFHNMVNASLHKPLINILEFKKIYNIEQNFIKTVQYKEDINI